MWSDLWPGWRAAAFCAVLAAGLGIAGATLFIASGIYNVGASSGHFAMTARLLEIALRRSVAAHSPEAPRRPLDDPGLIRLGAGHFASGCAFCHGAPGEPRGPIVGAMLPAPPPLSEAAPDWSAEQLYWIVKNGLKYTGMPAWTAQERGDEVWAVVAFLQALPGMSPQAYRKLIGAETDPDAPPGLDVCARCHGNEDSPPASAIVAKLTGQSTAYLKRALEEYRRGSRRSGIMQPVASRLSPDQRESFVAYYGRLARPHGPSDSQPPNEVARGRRIATEGLPERGIPACVTCHSGSASPAFPILHGQAAPYLMQQLRLFQTGVRDRTTYGAIMSVIASRLAETDMRDVSLYFESADLPAAPRIGEEHR